MRISTSQFYDQGVAAIERQQERLLHTQQQVAAGRRVLAPSDDPLAAAQALTLAHSKARVAQYAANIDTAKDALGQNETVLSHVTDLLQAVRTLAVSAGNGSLTDADRASLATDLAGRLDELVSLANSRDGDGRYLFAGYASDRQPFVLAAGGAVQYNGDQGRRTLDVAPGRTMAIGESGGAVFQAIRNGNGAFAANTGSGNAGTGVISAGTVTDPAALPGDTYRLTFDVTGGAITYDVTDVTTGSVSAGHPYAPGAAIEVAGMQVSITGQPAAGDTFTLAPSTSQDVFATIRALIDTLRAPASGGAGAARLANGTIAALANVDQALDHVLTVRAGIGASLRELDALATANADRSLQYDAIASRLTDLDYNQALSDLTRQMRALEAAQKSFASTSGLSLFDYL